MRKLLQVAVVSVLMIGFFIGCAPKVEIIKWGNTHNPNTSITSVGTDGTKMIKAWGEGETAEQAQRNARRNAVNAAIFHGFAAGGGSSKVGPIVRESDADTKHKAFFDDFFKNGGLWVKYVTEKGVPSGKDRLKTDKGYRIAVNVQVSFDALRKYLEEKEIARALDSGF